MLYTVSMRKMTYKSNRNVFYSCKYHVAWCPKYRRKVLGEEIAIRLSQIIHEVCAEHEAEVLSLEVMPDHVHLLVECDPQFGIHRLVRLIKGRSSGLLRQEFPLEWQAPHAGEDGGAFGYPLPPSTSQRL